MDNKPYTKDKMLFSDYIWKARAGHDNPKIIGGNDHSELNRTEGYEMLYFMNSLAVTWGWKGVSLKSFQNLERIIREEVPSNIRTHGKIRDWISENYKKV